MDRIAVLRAFARLVELGSFTAVAAEMRVKQSTVSKWLAALEDELGVPLVERTTRAQRITDAGAQFYRRCAAILDAYDDAIAEARDEAPAARGRIRMSVPVVFGRRYVIPLMTRLLQRHPQLEVEMVLSDRYVRLVEDGFDLAVRIGVPVDSSLRSHALGYTTRRLVASRSYLRAHGEPQTPTELRSHQCLPHADLDTATIWSFTRADKVHRAAVRGRIATNNSEAALALARAGLGIGLLASWLVDADLRAGRLVALLTDYAPAPAPVAALTAPGRHVPPRLRAVIEHLRGGLADALPGA